MTTIAKLTPASELIKSGVLTPTGLNTAKLGDITYNRAEALAAFFGTLRDAAAWAIGDLLVYADAAYGADEIYQLGEATGREPPTVGRYMRVSARVGAQVRRRELSWTHHRVVAKFDSPDEQTRWLDKAVQKRWTAGELQEQISADSGPRAGNEQGGGGSGGAVVVMELEKVARALVRAGNPDGNGFILVPVDAWARLLGVLGEE